MSDSESIHAAKIARIVTHPENQRKPSLLIARFETHGGFFRCEAWFQDGRPIIHVSYLADGVEQAEFVAAAIQMATEWIAEIQTERQGKEEDR